MKPKYKKMIQEHQKKEKLINEKLKEGELAFKTDNSTNKQQLGFIQDVIDNMYSHQDNQSHYGMLLSGDPGTGKTTSVKQLSRLLGVELFLIEAPHVLEEHLIKIPFVVYNPKTNKSRNFVEEMDEYGVVYSEAYMAQELNKLTKVSDSEYIDYIYKQDKNTVAIYESMGGTKEEMPDELVDARTWYDKILFIDEYFRADSSNIRNIFRRILNGLLGDTKIPENTYVIYASNLADEGLDTVSSHQVFQKYNMENRTKDEWFSWLVNKFKDDENIELDPQILNAFYNALEDSDISKNDLETEIRTSPRRWEQLLLYVNESLPINNASAASVLLANVKANFTDKDGKVSTLYPKIEKVVQELIKTTSGIDNEISPAEGEKWSDVLRHQIEMKMKLGSNRAYVPIVSGNVGIGKTSVIKQIAKDLKLHLIYIDASTINKEDVIGIPKVSKTPKAGEAIDMQFTPPKMLHMIEDQIKIAVEKNKTLEGDEGQGKWKYILFIDELDKVPNKTTFNAIRKVLLEKEFSDRYKLPDGMIILAAINPSGVEGSHEFTGHMKDVVDIINAKPDWNSQLQYLEGLELNEKFAKYKHKLLNVLRIFVDKFTLKSNKFSLNIGNNEELYISPRDYTNILINSVNKYGLFIQRNIKNSDEWDLSKFNKPIKEAVFSAYDGILDMNFHKAQLDYEDFKHLLKAWFVNNKELDFLLEDITTKSTVGGKGLKPALEALLKNPNYDLRDDMDFASYMSGAAGSITNFTKDLSDFVENDLVEGGEIVVDLHEPIHDYVHPEKGKMTFTTVQGMKQYLANIKSQVKYQEDPAKKADIENQIKGLEKILALPEDQLNAGLSKPYDKSYAHSKTYDLFVSKKVDHIIDALKDAIEMMGYSNIYVETVDRVFGSELRKLEKRYKGDWLKVINA